MSLSISIIVPAYNAEKNLQICLKHIFDSLTDKDELIVVNDGSTDNTENILKNNNCSYLNLIQNQGAAHARNRGAHLSQKDIIVFLDSDVLITSKYIEEIRNYFKKNSQVHTVTCGANSTYINKGFFTNFKNVYMDFITNHKEVEVNYVYGSLCATRRKSFIPWPESLRLTEDSLWGFEQNKLGMKIHSLGQIKPVHLKEYSFLSLIKNDYIISSYFAQSFFENNRWSTLYSNEKFGHTTKSQKMSVILAVLILILFAVNINIAFLFFVLWFILNMPFFIFIAKKRNIVFLLKSIAWYYFDCIIYCLGITHGFSQHIGLMPKRKLREVT